MSNDKKSEEPKFNRGSALSIFGSDRREDFMALVFALVIAFGVYFFV